MISRQSALLLLAAVLALYAAEAFTPSRYSSASVSQAVQESQRFTPRVGLTEDDEEEFGIMAEDDSDGEDYIVNVGDLEGDNDDDGAGTEDDGQPPAWALLQERLDATRAQHRRHEKDTGSPEYQVAGMTERITYLTGHLKEHPKDYSTRRGLVALVNKRRRLLNYLSREDVDRYKAVVASLGIRHKAPGLVTTKDEQYGRFPGQKAVKKHLVKKK